MRITKLKVTVVAVAIASTVLAGALCAGIIDLNRQSSAIFVQDGGSDIDRSETLTDASNGQGDGTVPTPSEGGAGGEDLPNGGQGDEGGSNDAGNEDGSAGDTSDGTDDDLTGDGSQGLDDDLPILITTFNQKSDIVYNVPSRCVLQSDVTNDCTVPVRMRTTLTVSVPASLVSVSALRSDGKIVPIAATSSSWLGSDYILSSGEYGDDCTWVYTPTHKSEAFTFFLNFTIEPGTDAGLTFFSYDADTGRQIGQVETAQLKVRGNIVVQTSDSGWTQWVYPTYFVNQVSAYQTINFHWQESAMATYTQIASTQTKFWIWGGAAEVYILNGGSYELLTPIIEYETEWYYYLPEHHGDGWTQQSVTLKIVLLEPGVEYRLGIDSIDPDTGYSISSFPGASWLFQT